MTRLCFFNTTRFWGGGEKWHFEIADYLSSRGHPVFGVVHPGSPLHRRLAGTPMDVLPMAASNLSILNPVKMLRLVSWFRSRRIQTVVFNGSSDVKLGAPAAAVAGVPARVYRRGLAVPVKNSLFNRQLYGRCITHFLANSEATARLLFRHPADRTRIIYNGIDLGRFNAPDPERRLRNRSDTVFIGTAGRLERQKGHDLLVAAAERLAASGLNFELLIAGEGSRRQNLSDQIEKTGLSRRVHLAGFVADMADFLGQLDIFVFPSLWEGFGYAAAEAMAAGLPVVAFDISSNPEIIVHESCGLLAPAGDADALAGAILRLAGDPDLRDRMGRRGRARVSALFNQETQLRSLEAFLCRDVLER